MGLQRVRHNSATEHSTAKGSQSLLAGASQVALVVKNPLADAGDIRDLALIPGSGIPWRQAWQPTPVFLSRESHGQASLTGYSP